MHKRLRIAASSSRGVYLLLALVLLIGQVAAQAHVYSHLKSTIPRSDFGAAGQLCSECLSSAPLLSAAGSPASPFVAFIAAETTPVDAVIAARVDAARHYAFRSRAPPHLL
jgi:hypothetical protein